MTHLVGFTEENWHAARLRSQADALGLRLEPCLECMPDLSVPNVLIGAPSLAKLKASLNKPSHGFIEWNDHDGADLSRACVECATAGGQCLSLNTKMAYEWDATNLFASALEARFPHLGDIMGDIELALAEAVANAVVHGNLGIESTLRNDVKGFVLFQAALLERLDDPVLCRRRIEITAEPFDSACVRIEVQDFGDGYDLAALPKEAVTALAKSGRGLGLIRQLTATMGVSDSGRRLTMTFNADKAPKFARQ